MSFNAMFNNDNDCSVNQFNPLNNVLKNYDQDKSIQKVYITYIYYIIIFILIQLIRISYIHILPLLVFY